MAEAKHTPGPWTIEEYGDDETPSLVIHKDSESRVCFMATPGSRGDPEVIAADARLISAAPDLYAALKDMFALMDEGLLVRNTGNDGEPGWAMRQLPLVQRLSAAGHAIAKAEGTS